jgi:AcrR family transcriptional regulator
MSTADSITEAALGLFYRQGFHASGVEQLSQVAGVTKKTLYRHFPSKEHLVEAALCLRDAQFMAKMQAAMEAAPDAQRPLAYIDFIAAWAREPDFHGCTFINAAAEYAEAGEPPHVLARQHKEQVLVYLEEVCARAGLGQPLAAARQLFLIGEGLIVACQVGGATQEMIDSARGMVGMLVAAAKGS